jgi:hypothetical protein
VCAGWRFVFNSIICGFCLYCHCINIFMLSAVVIHGIMVLSLPCTA